MKQEPNNPEPRPCLEPWMLETRLVKALDSARQDIIRHKWFESEKAGHDIGWDRAVVDWTLRYGHTLDEPPRPGEGQGQSRG